MPVIERVETTRKIQLGELFDELGFSSSVNPTDESGDSYIVCDWDIEVLGEAGYCKIEGLRWTKPEPVIELVHRTTAAGEDRNDKSLFCSPEHLVQRTDAMSTEWVYVKDLKQGDFISCESGLRCVTATNSHQIVERLCDIQVADTHSYFADGVLSHNSHFLTMIGANALRQKKNVLHYTFELSQAKTGIRYDSNLCDIDSNNVLTNKEELRRKYEDTRGALGKLIIKFYPSGTASVQTLRSHMEKLELKGFRPDILLIDYADIMRSTRQYDSLRHELNLVYTELRGLADELQIPVWSASQSNREGSQADVIDLNNMSESYGKAFVADVVLTLSRKSYEKASGWGRLFIAKNRAGRDGILYPIRIDTARSQFFVSTPTDDVETAVKHGQDETKKRLLDKLRELDRDGITKKSEEV